MPRHHLDVDEVHSNRENHTVVYELGGEAHIQFTENATGKTRWLARVTEDVPKFQLESEEFGDHYHKRSNVETVFHMLKTKFGEEANAKNERAQFTEMLLKVLCHNVVVVIHELRESDVSPESWPTT